MYIAFLIYCSFCTIACNYFLILISSLTVYLSSVRLSFFLSLSLGLYQFDIDIGDKDYENSMVSNIDNW